MTHALHLTLVKKYWTAHVRPGDTLLDATCGNGHDTLFLCSLLQGRGELIALDIQESALQNTALRLQTLPLEFQKTAYLLKQCHSKLPKTKEPPHLIVYNLGYLPGGDKNATTKTETTLESLQDALQILGPGGAISIMCYPGHEEGVKETEKVISFLKSKSVIRYQYTQIPERAFQRCELTAQVPTSPLLLWLTT